MTRDLYQTHIEKKINKFKPEYVFSSSDFIDIASIGTINKVLSRLNKENCIRRITHSVYDKPIYSKLLHSYNAPNINNVATALARKYNWTIAPARETALNILGLSTQVSNNFCYISDGPYRKYKIGKYKLEFRHCANKEISKKSLITITVIQAIKYIGKDNIDDSDLKRISSRLSVKDKKLILKEAISSTSWVYSLIKKVCH